MERISYWSSTDPKDRVALIFSCPWITPCWGAVRRPKFRMRPAAVHERSPLVLPHDLSST